MTITSASKSLGLKSCERNNLWLENCITVWIQDLLPTIQVLMMKMVHHEKVVRISSPTMAKISSTLQDFVAWLLIRFHGTSPRFPAIYFAEKWFSNFFRVQMAYTQVISFSIIKFVCPRQLTELFNFLTTDGEHLNYKETLQNQFQFEHFHKLFTQPLKCRYRQKSEDRNTSTITSIITILRTARKLYEGAATGCFQETPHRST
uniref:Uncharacterized protein n=2 Tax=Opuntia streptacantha TaxID=393608 RepID=A0A7C9A3C3_OPUST